MDLLEAVREAGVVVDILRAERMDETVFDAIFQKAADIASEFQVNNYILNNYDILLYLNIILELE